MSGALRHRGPDDHGVWCDDEVGLGFGFRRLSIVDLSSLGHQPMRSASGRYVVMFNGEIYNFRPLRQELEGFGHHFRGGSDTEVLLAAVEQWGVRDGVRRLIGMFAIAIWDSELRRLHLVRDRLGIKPLYVYWGDGMCAFGSELKAFVAGPGFDGAVDRNALVSYFRYHYIPEPATVYRRVRKLLPGTILTIADPAKEPPAPVPYWSLVNAARTGTATPLSGSDDEIVAHGHALLRDVVRDHLYADVPLGAFLSGGIDSSLVVALMCDAAGDRVKSFSIAFEDADYDESAHAAAVARHLGTAHTEMHLRASDVRDVVPRLPFLFDEPFGNSSAIATLLVCELARKHVAVALSGSGGDELFCGYSRYVHGERIVRALSRFPMATRRFASAAITAVPSVTWDRLYRTADPLLPKAARRRLPNFRGAKMTRFGELLGQPTAPSMYRSMMSGWERPDQLVTGGCETPALFEARFSDVPDAELMEQFMLLDQHGYLVGDQLTSVDRVSMGVSLEARVPLLDHRVAEYSWQLPRQFKIRDGTGKWLLRRILDEYVPRELVDRPKMGLSLPIGRWLVGPLRPWAEELLAADRIQRDGILQAQPIRKAWQELLSGGQQWADGIWTVLMFQAWNERWRGISADAADAA